MSASKRPAASVTVPAPTGTTSVTGRDGHLSCASAPDVLDNATAVTAATMVMGKGVTPVFD